MPKFTVTFVVEAEHNEEVEEWVSDTETEAHYYKLKIKDWDIDELPGDTPGGWMVGGEPC